MTIDGAFDSIVMAGEDVTLKLGSSMFRGPRRHCALGASSRMDLRYHTMLNTLMVDMVTSSRLLLAGLALGLERSVQPSRHSKYWRKIVLLNVISTAAYAVRHRRQLLPSPGIRGGVRFGLL